MASLYKLNSYFPKHHSCVKLLHISVLTCFHWLFRVFIFKPFHVCRGQTTGLLSEVQLKKWINVYNIRLTKVIESCLMKNKDKRQELLLNRTKSKWEAGDVSGSNLSCAVATSLHVYLTNIPGSTCHCFPVINYNLVSVFKILRIIWGYSRLFPDVSSLENISTLPLHSTQPEVHHMVSINVE